jgi:hypothetical protein
MNRQISPDVPIIVTLVISILFLWRVSKSISKKADKGSALKSAMRVILLLLVLIILLSIFFYWILREYSDAPAGFDAWVISLDITLAHIFVTLLILLLSYFLAKPLLQFIGYLIYIIVVRPISRLMSNITGIGYPDSWFVFTLENTRFVLSSLGMYFVFKHFFIRTSFVQVFLFGNFDPSLGFKTPTTVESHKVIPGKIAQSPIKSYRFDPI